MLQRFKKRSLKSAIILIIVGAVLFCFVRFTSSRCAPTSDFNKFMFNVMYNDRRKTKFVLYWSPFWTTWDYMLGYGYEPFKNCKYSNCFATANRSALPLDQFDALIFHAAYNKKKHGVPWIRSPHQRYIFTNVEPPVYICPNLKQYSSYFNWTMSYRFDSDIVRRHGYLFKQTTNYTIPSQAFVKNKSHLASWMASNCRTSGRREELVKEIQKFVPVDVYGACGRLQCPRKKGNGKISSPECYSMIEKKYKFYLSFENSYCRDYSTEKLYNILLTDVVPVVYGFGNYKLSAPPDSVINVEDFESAEELVKYLYYLSRNVEEYLKYFEWKKHYWITTSVETSACQMCKKLHEPLAQSIYHDLHSWWWGNNKSNCKTEKSLPKIVSDVLH